MEAANQNAADNMLPVPYDIPGEEGPVRDDSFGAVARDAASSACSQLNSQEGSPHSHTLFKLDVIEPLLYILFSLYRGSIKSMIILCIPSIYFFSFHFFCFHYCPFNQSFISSLLIINFAGISAIKLLLNSR